MQNDMTVGCGNGVINIRAGAIIYKNGKLLVCGTDEVDFLFSIGGRLQFGETAEEAVRREVLEETGTALEVDRLGFVVESYFEGDSPGKYGKLVYEIAYFFFMKVPDDFEPKKWETVENGRREYLTWVSPDTDRVIYPRVLQEEPIDPDGGLRHILNDEREKFFCRKGSED